VSLPPGCFVVAAIISAALAGCASLNPEHSQFASSARASPATSASQPEDRTGTLDLTGVWEGMRIDNCDMMQVDPTRCNAMMQLTLTMLQHANKISGFYRCATGTVDCYNMDETGVIKNGVVRPGLLQFRVMLDDGSSCLFNSVPQDEMMYGGFICLQGAAVLERGRWRAQRSY
jgi:hypothetical protein